MRRLALVLCLMLGVLVALMPRVALAAEGAAMAHGTMMAAGKPCAGCPETPAHSPAQPCAAMGALCGVGVECGASLVPLVPSLATLPAALSLAPPMPALSQAVAQRALVPEPPPPRA